MAQLIKLEDYISRYQWNIYRYPSQFIRLKQENWKKLYDLWIADQMNGISEEQEIGDEPSVMKKWKSWFKRNEEKEEPVEETNLPKTEIELKHYFLDRLFSIQLKWASSTVTDLSFMKQKYYGDATLKYFLQRFPDTYLFMYYPVFSIKNAPVDGEIILISPIAIEIISLCEKSPNAMILAADERTWEIAKDKDKTKILSPFIALKRTEQIVKSILNKEAIDFPIKKVVLSRVNHIVYQTEPHNSEIIGKQTYENWFEEKRQLTSPLKNRQLKAAGSLLKHCLTTSVKRPEWEEEEPIFSVDNEG